MCVNMGGGGSTNARMTKPEREKNNIKERLQAIVDNEGDAGGYHYSIEEREWENYGKSRTYYSIVETRDNSKHYAKVDYGYYDNKAEKYIPGRADVMKNYSFGGNVFDIDKAIKEKKRKKK